MRNILLYLIKIRIVFRSLVFIIPVVAALFFCASLYFQYQTGLLVESASAITTMRIGFAAFPVFAVNLFLIMYLEHRESMLSREEKLAKQYHIRRATVPIT